MPTPAAEASQLRLQVERAQALLDERRASDARTLLAEVVAQEPLRGKIDEFAALLSRIDAPRGSKLFRMRALGRVPQLNSDEARSLHLLAIASRRQGTDVRCGDRGSDSLLLLAALNKHADSEFQMGALLAGGTPCSWAQDLEAAAYWYGEAAAQGHENARVNHAVALLLGKGLPKDEKRAVEVLTDSARVKGNARAQYLLGTLHASGYGVRKNQRTALSLFRAAAEQGFFPAQTSLGKLLWERAIAQEEFDEARTWLIAAAGRGDPQAQYTLGKAYIAGTSGEFWRYAEATKWLELAARAGHPQAQTTLGLHLWDGDERTKSAPARPEVAVRWFRAAADQGEALAQTYLGYAHATGKGAPQDFALAVSWWRQAATKNESRAEEALGDAYLKGLGVPKDEYAAREWYRKSATHGSHGAQAKLTGDEMRRLGSTEAVIQLGIVLIGAALIAGPSGDLGPQDNYFCAGAFSCTDVDYNTTMTNFALPGG